MWGLGRSQDPGHPGLCLKKPGQDGLGRGSLEGVHRDCDVSPRCLLGRAGQRRWSMAVHGA